MKRLGDYCQLPKGYYGPDQSVLLSARAGDLILWDSRTVHGGKVGKGRELALGTGSETSLPELARLSVPVCLTPRSGANPEVLNARLDMFATGQTTNHWPHQPRVVCKVCIDYHPIELSPEQAALL